MLVLKAGYKERLALKMIHAASSHKMHGFWEAVWVLKSQCFKSDGDSMFLHNYVAPQLQNEY